MTTHDIILRFDEGCVCSTPQNLQHSLGIIVKIINYADGNCRSCLWI